MSHLLKTISFVRHFTRATYHVVLHY